MGKKIKGFLWIAKDGNYGINMTAMDGEAGFPTSSKVTEAAALTFKKR
jgi:hypothetical protein